MANQETSPLEERLRTDIKDAQRQRDQVRLDTLRGALNAFHLEEVARTDEKHASFRVPLLEQDRIGIIEKLVKQRDEAAQFYRSGGRTESALQEEREASLLKEYLPAQMSDDELRQAVRAIIAHEGNDFRKVMPVASRDTKGRADGRRVQQIVRELTAS
ncbi:MAG: GatB/YqeY domain-containing protein [Ktedonobacterales bacterium]